jgi:hypothetical protein
MPTNALPLANHVMTAEVLTLVVPLGVLILVVVWYWLLWRRGTGER